MKNQKCILATFSIVMLCLLLTSISSFSSPNPAPAGVRTESRRDSATYDFHYDIRYPGYLRSDTSYDKVTEEKSADIRQYSRRVVEFWPKRGVDVTPIEDIVGAPKRLWTPVIPDDTWSKTVLDNFPSKPFEAYLVGFRGVGDDALANISDPNSFSCPAPVLLLPDGRKRVILAKHLSPEDRQFLIGIYKKDLQRISQTLLKADYLPELGPKESPFAAGENALYKDHDLVRFDTDHFSILVPGKTPEAGRSWVRKDQNEQVMQTIQLLKNQLEAYWGYLEYSGALVRYWEQDTLRKYAVTVGNGGGGGGGGYGGCGMGGPYPYVVFHEWGHGMPVGGLGGLGGNEAAADALSIMGKPSDIKRAGQLVARPWKNFFHGSYRGGSGYEILADDPNWGYAITAVTSNLAASADYTPMHVYTHLGVERGLWTKADGIKGMGDLMGQIGARFAEFDCFQEFQFRSQFGAPNRSYLVPVDIAKGIYRCPAGEAPEPFGVSISRLVAGPNAKTITVDFEGDYDPETYSDWRACIVAVGRDNRCRYSPLWNKGLMSMDIKEGDKRYWLTVTATPKALLQGTEREDCWVVYQGGFAYRYPYQVTLTNCRPGSAYANIAENNNSLLAAPEWSEAAFYGDLFDLPVKMNDAEKKSFCGQLEAIMQYASAEKTRVEQQYSAADADAFVHERWDYRWKIRMLEATIQRASLLMRNLDGAPHQNGGGWVSADSYAAPTAYVGKDCYVLDGARVLDNAVLIDSAVVRGEGAVVKDNAKLSGKAAVIGDVVVGGFARVINPIINQPNPLVAKADRVTQYVYGTPQDELFEGNLVANYECLRQESTLFEDLLKTRSSTAFYNGGHMTKSPVSYDGCLIGNPGFAEADGNGAVVFNGKSQHAELAPDAIDFGEIVVVARIRPDSVASEQTVFDFGCSLDNRLILELRKGGVPVLSWQAKQKKSLGKIAGSVKLAPNKWASLRLEIDGERVALYLDDRLILKETTSFRPADVFAPQLGRQNLLFRSRDDRHPNYLGGQLDFVRIYSRVPEDYAALPQMPLISPTKAMGSVLAALQKRAAENKSEPVDAEHVGICLAFKNGWLHNTYTWNDSLLEWRYLQDWKVDVKTSGEITALRDKTYELESQYLLKRFELQREFVKANASRALPGKPNAAGKRQRAEGRQPVNKELEALDRQLRTIQSAAQKQVFSENAAVVTAIDSLKRQIDVRKQQLANEVGPVAKVFGPAVRSYNERITNLEAKGTKRTAAESAELGKLQSELKQLIALRENVLIRRVNDRVPPSGLWYLDSEIRSLRERLASNELLIDSLCNQSLLKNSAYIALKLKADRLRSISKPSEAPVTESSERNKAEEWSSTAFDGYLKNYPEIAELHKSAQAAALDWYQRCTGVMYSVVPPEYYFPNDPYYKGRDYTLATNAQDVPYFKQFRNSTDDIAQLKAAIGWQKNWLKTCDDWDTANVLEKNYDKQNDRVKRWLKRVKPYRYSSASD